MAKVQVIQKSRKECRCSKCGKVIPVGSKYYKGEINFGPTIRRCADCGLESWEITTSEYKLQVGEIVNRWEQNYGCDEPTVDDIVSALEEAKEGCEERFDAIPESLQEADAGQMLQERIDCLDSAISDMESIDIDEIKSDAVRSAFAGRELTEEEDEKDYDEWLEYLEDGDDMKIDLISAFEDGLRDAIDEVLSQIDY